MSRLTGIMAAMAGAMMLFAFAPATSAQNLFRFGGPSTPPALASKLGHPVSAQLMATLTRASRAGLQLDTAPTGNHLLRISGPRPNTGTKVGMLYVGADFCPYCAAQRWGLMLALLRFGKFSGLRYMLSSAADAHPNTPTVTFQHADYRSKYVAFQAVETADRERHPLMTPNPLQIRILTTYDAPPYVHFAQSIPFVYVGGRYVLSQLLVSPQPLDGENWQQIADTLADPHSLLFQAVMPRVNLLTAALCQLDGDKPANVCSAPGVRAARAALAKPRPSSP